MSSSGATQAVRASAFTASIGVETHLAYDAANGDPQSPYASLSTVEAALAYLNPDGIGTGVSTVRDDTWAPTTELAVLGSLGYALDIYAAYSSPGNTTAASVIAALSPLVADGYVRMIEGPLEVDNSGWGLAVTSGDSYTALNGTTYTGWNAAVMMQDDLDSTFGAKVPVGLFSLAIPTDGASNGPAVSAASSLGMSLGGIASSGNVHFYEADGEAPSVQLAGIISEETGYTPGMSFAITEAGFNDLNQAGTGYYGNDYVNGVYTLDLVLDAFKDGAQLTDLYELFDENMGYTGSNAYEDNWGLFNADGTPKDSATFLHNMLTVIGDPGANAATFTPGSMNYSVSQLPSAGESLLLQQSDGNYDIIVWSNANIDTGGTQTTAPTENVTVNLGATYSSVEVFDPTTGTSPVSEFANVSSVTVALSNHPLIISVDPQNSTSTSTPAPTPAPTPTPAPAATDQLTLNVSEIIQHHANLEFNLFVNGTEVASDQTLTASRGGRQTQTFTYTGAWGSDPVQVGVQLVNPAGYRGGGGATLYVGSIGFNGTTTAENVALTTNAIRTFSV